MSKKLIIGTRGSLLAVTQCTLIKEQLEQRTGYQFELKLIKTQGDQVTDKPLWQLEGKDFFTKELDAALLTDEVDLVVHSYKDLGSERPEGIALGAITQRSFANDILLIKKDTIKNLGDIQDFIIGTSSPRRIENTSKNITHYLPNFKANAKVRCEVLRGNVNTRIQKLKDGQYHAIVLAMAGLERLAEHPSSRDELKELLQGLDFLVLPQREFTSSASQGALAIEYHKNGPRAEEILAVLKSVHCNETAAEIARERQRFNSYGGGCHLAVGIYVKKVKENFIHIEKGSKDHKVIDEAYIEGQDLSQLEGKKSFLVLGEMDKLTVQKPLVITPPTHGNLFVTSKHCFHTLGHHPKVHLWAGGTRTAKQLVAKGYWVNGASDFAGHDELVQLKNSHLISILTGNDWHVLSHDQAESPVGPVIGCYTRLYNREVDPEILKSDVIFWGSFEQYRSYLVLEPKLATKIHTCGLGKTYETFLQNGIAVTPIVDMKKFKEITKVIS